MRQLKNFSNKTETPVTDKEAVKDYISKYDGQSEEQLVTQLVNAVKTAKQNGTYDEAQMQTFISMVSPQLSEAQRSKLENMLELIKTEV